MLRFMDSKTRSFCPSESKAARFQASLSSWAYPSRNLARSAFKRFFYHEPSHNPILSSFGLKLRVFGIHWPELSQYILAVRLCRIPSKSKFRRLNLLWSLRLFSKTMSQKGTKKKKAVFSLFLMLTPVGHFIYFKSGVGNEKSLSGRNLSGLHCNPLPGDIPDQILLYLSTIPLCLFGRQYCLLGLRGQRVVLVCF